MSSSTTRPPTSKPRGVCRYYTDPRGCFTADCKFLHGELPREANHDPPLLTLYDKTKRCRFYAQGFCKRGDACWFLHISDRKTGDSTTLSEDEDEEFCSICFEKPVTFGLLGGCSHIFCITCIKQWRDPKNKQGGVLESGNTKKCPMCRAPTNFITPSSKFWKAGTKEKDEIIKAYKDSMSRVPCRYFQKSLHTKPLCPYGKDCFYQHINADGTPYIFKEGVDAAMRKYRRRPRSDNFNIMTLSLDFADFLLPIERSTRFTIREQPIGASQSNTTDHPTQPRHRRRDQDRSRMNGLTNAARRLQQVGESLERLNDVISEGATLDSLNTAVEALRAGLGRLDEDSGDSRRRPDRVTRQRVDEENGGTAERQEDEVMERLEVLADQMLASIQVLRMNAQEEEIGRDEVETPPPALVSLERNGRPSRDTDFDMPSPQLRPFGWRENMDDGYESADSMPTLRSVSNSSDDEMIDSSDEDSYEDEGPSTVLTAAHAVERIQPIQQLSGSQGRFHRAVVTRTAVEEEEGGNMDSESETPSELSEIEPRSEPPFVTDGRGRVVWTSPAEEDKSTEEQNREPVSRPEAATGSGGLLGWFNALF